MNATPRTAWLRIENGFAVLCAWCDDLHAAEARAQAAGLKTSHGICTDCAREKMGVEISAESFATVKAAGLGENLCEIVPFPRQRQVEPSIRPTCREVSPLSAAGANRPNFFAQSVREIPPGTDGKKGVGA